MQVNKNKQEEAVGIQLKGVAKLFVNRIKTGQLGRWINSHGVIKKVKQKKTEHVRMPVRHYTSCNLCAMRGHPGEWPVR